MDVLLAPPGRLSPATSHLFVDLLLGGWLLVAVGIAALFAFLAWSRAKKLGAEVWHKRGLRPGPILLPGVAAPLDDDQSGQPFIELSIDQRGVERSSKNGRFVVWTETSRTLRDRAFVLRCDNGERVRVEPSGRVDLIDRLDDTHRLGPAARRRSARIVEGETVWIRGELVDAGASGDGPYRGGAPTHRWVLRPPARGSVFLSSEPVELEGRAEARFHTRIACVYLAYLALCQLAFFADYRALRADGVQDHAVVTRRTTWITRSKSTTTKHYGFHVSYADHQDAIEETNSHAYAAIHEGDRVPIVYVPRKPTVVQLGAAAELGLNAGAGVVGLIFGGMLTMFYLALNAGRRPWWRRRKLVETVRGTL